MSPKLSQNFVREFARPCEWPPIHIRRKSDNHCEEGQDLSLLEFKTIEYRRKGFAVATDEQLKQIARIPNGSSCAGESISTRLRRFVNERL